MIKYLIVILISVTFSYAGLINKIAITVNNEPITLYDIDEKINQDGINKDKAVSSLIDKILYKQSLEKYNVNVDFFDIDNYIEKLAKSNNMSVYQFKNAVKQQQDYNLFKQQIKQQLMHQKLIQNIASNKIKRASVDDLKIYYENHKDQFTLAKKIDVIQYSSKNKQALLTIKSNPMMMNKDVVVKNITYTQKTMQSQIKYIINQAKAQTFTPIFAANRAYNMFFISKKEDLEVIKFDDVKDKIFSIVMAQREKDYLKDYFETLKITADIKVLK